MKRRLLTGLLILALLALTAAAGACESLFICNRESDLKNPERLNLRAEPSSNGAIIGLYYTGAEVENLGAENDAFVRVRIGGVTGYMVRQYLVTADEAAALYGEGSGFGDCRAAEIDLTGMWKNAQPMYEARDAQSAAIATLRTGDAVHLIGILDDWAYIAAHDGGEKRLGYVPLDTLTDVGENKVSVVAGARADGVITLYNLPNNSADAIMQLKNGASCFALFGRGEGNWRRVRVGGVTGWIKYTQAGDLASIGGRVQRSAVPYYPLLMQTKTDALLRSEPGGSGGAFMTVGQGMAVEVLAERGEYAYVRTCEGGVGACDSGDFGYMALSDLTLSEPGESVGVAQMDDGDLPVLLFSAPAGDARRLGALCAGAQVCITDYTQTDYVRVVLGELTGYVRKAQIRVVGDSGVAASERIPQRARAKEALSLLAEPSQDAQAVVSVEAGERVYMLGTLEDWAYVRFGDGPGLETGAQERSGFVPLSSLEAPASTTHLTASVTTDKVNLRDRGDLGGEIIARARLNECLRVAEFGVDWSCVVTPEGKRGYIMTEYLAFD